VIVERKKTAPQSCFVHANGIDIHYLEAGKGTPLVLLHGGLVSSNPIWAGVPVSYADHLAQFAEHFRVIAPDTRGAGKTIHQGGEPTFDLLVDDVLALIEALSLDRPLIAGFSEGGITAAILAIRRPDAVSALVNYAGHDFFNPEARSYAIMRQMLGGSLQATQADPDAVAASFGESPQMQGLFELFKADEDGGQGDGHWRDYLKLVFPRTTSWPGYGFADLRKLKVPALILVGDRDEYCSVEEAILALRELPDGELAVLPGTGHVITPAGVAATIEFFERRLATKD